MCDAVDSGSQKVLQRGSENHFQSSYHHNSATRMVQANNSAANDRAPGARSKSEEFSGGPSIVSHLDSGLYLKLITVESMLHLLGSGVKSDHVSTARTNQGTHNFSAIGPMNALNGGGDD